MPVKQVAGRVTLTHSKGSSVELLLYGATVISWKSGTITESQPIERLFVSSKAALDGSKPVRGGIPVIFPCFGAPTHPEHMKLGQHGFARNELWTFDSIVMDSDAGVSVRLTLEPTSGITAKYDKPFHLAYVVTLAEHQLSTDLHVTNTSTSTAYPPDNLEFQALFHNYIRAPANDALVFPLQNKSYYDKTEPSEEARSKPKLETRAGVDVRQFTDSVYEDAGGKYEVTWPGGGVEITVRELKDVVVWNPQQAAGSKMGDMEDGGWERYVCVEPGYVRGFAKIEPGKTWIGQQTISVIHHERRINQL
ncbi:galactose mutarotase-like domain-containing protein [Suillus paluster]|uniref:galactose mutarotase-like domain-containing protein n=1 Tax=Suillus paluster TaxID=48578 RepID=UPI001B85DD7A|nr:galactose mutarotase-like domain-containing protein [Suillus paluster]KAG1750000.1 galactose mutarotase-like domain-containing protein [Suillus paluster]